MSEKIKNIKKLLVEDNLTYSGQLRFLAYTVKLEEENQKLQLKNKQLKDRINKAIEYIESSSLEVNTRDYGMLTVCNSDDLLPLLKGDKERVE